MAVTVNNLTVTSRKDQIVNQAVTPFHINATTADGQGCEELVAAPGAGYAHVVEHLQIHIGAAITVTVGSGAAAGAVEGDKMGPLGGAVGTFTIDRRERPIQLTTNKSLTFDASGAGTVCITADGFTKAV